MDPKAQLFRKGGKEAKLCCLGRMLLTNRHCLVILPRLKKDAKVILIKQV
jgi:hypothetical protein